MCESQTDSLDVYFDSVLDAIAWRFAVTESISAEATIPGRRELGTWPHHTWGSVYPRCGWVTHPHMGKAAALIAQRAGDIVTRRSQLHVYQELPSTSENLWAPAPLHEGSESTGKWQMVSPTVESRCGLFGRDDRSWNSDSSAVASDADQSFAWNLWRRVRMLRTSWSVVSRRCGVELMSAFISSAAAARLACLILLVSTTAHAQITNGPTEDSTWYYEIGGAEPVAAPLNPGVTSIGVGGSAELSAGFSCGQFNPVVAVAHSLNELSQGIDNMVGAMTAAATSAIASLPALILQRANPGLYDLFQNALLRAEYSVDVATKSCEQMERAIAAGKNPYRELVVLSKGNDWSRAMGVPSGDIVETKEQVESSNGSNGIPWVGGVNAGGSGQDPLRFTEDVVSAGYNLHLSRSVTDTSPAPTVNTTQNCVAVANTAARDRLGARCSRGARCDDLRWMSEVNVARNRTQTQARRRAGTR